MNKLSYLLLIILTIIAMLGGIAAKTVNSNNDLIVWTMLATWIIVYLFGIGGHRSIQSWSIESMATLFFGILLIYSCGYVIQNIALLPSAILAFSGSTFVTAKQFEKGE